MRIEAAGKGISRKEKEMNRPLHGTGSRITVEDRVDLSFEGYKAMLSENESVQSLNLDDDSSPITFQDMLRLVKLRNPIISAA